MSTTYGWDTSSHDSTPASRDGIDFFTCKLTDGDHYYENPTFAAKINAMRGFGVEILGAYHVLWGNRSIANQVNWYVQRLDAVIPWWRDFEYFICQSDNEPFYTGVQTAPSISQINEFHDRMITATGGKIDATKNEAYAPSWHYGSSISGLKYNWWPSNYGSNPTGHYPDIYPGNSSSRWNGPIAAFLLQYGSNAIIAGQDTSDANAYRGTLDQLKAALGGDVTTWNTDDLYAIDAAIAAGLDVATRKGAPLNLDLRPMWERIGKEAADAVAPQLDEIQASLARIEAALANGGGGGHFPTPPWTVTFAGQGTIEEPAP